MDTKKMVMGAWDTLKMKGATAKTNLRTAVMKNTLKNKMMEKYPVNASDVKKNLAEKSVRALIKGNNFKGARDFIAGKNEEFKKLNQ